MSIAIVVPPYRVDSQMAGIGVRAWELAQVLAQRMPVTIVAKHRSDFHCEGVKFVAASEESWRDEVKECSAALFYDMPDTRMMLEMYRAGKLIISDNAVTIEHLEYHGIRRSENPDAAYEELITRFKLQLLISDHFIVRSHVARATLLAQLSLMGRLSYVNYDQSPSLDHLVSFIPIGFNRLSGERAEGISASLPVVDLVWNGGIWDFYDPVILAQAIAVLDRAGTPVTIRFMYMPPSDQLLREASRLAQSVRELGIDHLVQFHTEPLGHYQRDEVVKSATAAICIAKYGIENFTSIRLRVRDCFLYRMPLIVDKHGATADLVRELGIGLTCSSHDVNDLASGLAKISFDKSCYDQLARNIEELRSDFEIDPYVLRFAEVINRAKRAPDIGTSRHNSLLSDLLSRAPFLEESPVYPF